MRFGQPQIAAIVALLSPGNRRDRVHAASGIVERIDASTVVIAHEAIRSLGWPAMTMPFTARGAAGALTPGDQVGFSFRVESGRAVIERIEKSAG
ncbi:copper-binding protein [Jeongeupia sp. USM3]|uniref:copper-binding protein n=1 Tax=Jeongeupia sp. USM3 TaxID=1906741 RepID=UPI00089DFD7C|nr:copper-binding protein [Jeongeupia sp. USM3]AOX99049.1 hypothetical protein BJP62_00430 [Jeongeupia sp. USM3]